MVKKEKVEYKTKKKRSGRFAVVSKKDGKNINGEEKVKILVKEGLIKLSKGKPKAEPAPEAAPKPAETE